MDGKGDHLSSVHHTIKWFFPFQTATQICLGLYVAASIFSVIFGSKVSISSFSSSIDNNDEGSSHMVIGSHVRCFSFYLFIRHSTT